MSSFQLGIIHTRGVRKVSLQDLTKRNALTMVWPKQQIYQDRKFLTSVKSCDI